MPRFIRGAFTVIASRETISVCRLQNVAGLGYEKLMTTLGEKLSEAAIAELAAKGAAWSEDQAVEEALNV